VLSMDNEEDYGKCFFHMSYKEAISQGIISDYKILTMTVSDDRVRRLIAENRILSLNLRNLDEAEAQSAAAGVALKHVFKKQKIKHAISFHRSIRGARSLSGTARRLQSSTRHRPKNNKSSHFKQENSGRA